MVEHPAEQAPAGCACALPSRLSGAKPRRDPAVYPLKEALLTAASAPAPPPPLSDADGLLAPDGSVIDVPMVLSRIYASGIEPSLRPRFWLHLLGVTPWNASAAALGELRAERERAYADVLALWSALDAANRLDECAHGCTARYYRIITADVSRTDRTLERWKAAESLVPLRRLLLSACAMAEAPGYHQGMNDLAAVLLVAFGGDEPDAFAALCALTLASSATRREAAAEAVGASPLMGMSFEQKQQGIWRQSAAVLGVLRTLDPPLLDSLVKAGAVRDSGECLVLYQPIFLVLKREIGHGPNGDYGGVCAAWEVWWATADAQASAEPPVRCACAHFQIVLVLAFLELNRAGIRANRTGMVGLTKLLSSATFEPEQLLRVARAIHAALWEQDEVQSSKRAGDATRTLAAGPLHATLWSRSLVFADVKQKPAPATSAAPSAERHLGDPT